MRNKYFHEKLEHLSFQLFLPARNQEIFTAAEEPHIVYYIVYIYTTHTFYLLQVSVVVVTRFDKRALDSKALNREQAASL